MSRGGDRLGRFWFADAPASRLAVLRILVGTYSLWYLWTRYDMILRIADSDAKLFRPVGVANLLREPLEVGVFHFVFLATLAFHLMFILGWKHRITGPVFGALLLFTFCYRNSWSMIYHSHNPVVFHGLILALTPAADALSLDALRRPPGVDRWQGRRREGDWQYGWPIRLICASTVAIYFLAGVAKVTGPSGWAWALGDNMRKQIAVDAMRKELFGSTPPEAAFDLYGLVLLFTLMGVGTLILELGAPAALLERRLGYVWAINAWLVHWGILFVMDIKFRYQLVGFIFASFFPVERLVDWPAALWRRARLPAAISRSEHR